MKQTEITVQVFDNIKTIVETLSNQGYSEKEQFVLDDTYYSKHSVQEVLGFDYRTLVQKSLLVRQITGNQTKTELIYKNKTINNNGIVAAEEKYKTNIENKQATEKILSCAGMVPYCNLVQKCKVFSNGKFEFVVQETDNLGIFIEAEENNQMNKLSPEQKIEQLKALVNSLHLKLGTDYSCKKTYMLLHKK